MKECIEILDSLCSCLVQCSSEMRSHGADVTELVHWQQGVYEGRIS